MPSFVCHFLCATAATAVAHFRHRNSVCPSVTQVDQSKTVQARITKFFTVGCLADSSFRISKAFP